MVFMCPDNMKMSIEIKYRFLKNIKLYTLRTLELTNCATFKQKKSCIFLQVYTIIVMILGLLSILTANCISKNPYYPYIICSLYILCG